MVSQIRLNALPGIGGFLTQEESRQDAWEGGLNALPGIGGFLTSLVRSVLSLFPAS